MIRCPSLAACIVAVLSLASCKPGETQQLLAPDKALGKVLAEQVAALAGANHQVVIIGPDTSWGPVSTAEEAFRAALKKQNLSVAASVGASLGDPMKAGAIGLKSADFFAALEKNPSAGAIISLVGAPLFQQGDDAKLAAAHPPIVVVAIHTLGNIPGVPANPATLAAWVDRKYIQLAIVDGQGQPAAGGKSDATHALFYENFQILRSTDTEAH